MGSMIHRTALADWDASSWKRSLAPLSEWELAPLAASIHRRAGVAAPLQPHEAAELEAYNRALAPDAEAAAVAIAGIAKLRRDDALAIVTGQQVGIAGGPIYTVAKALGAIVLAARLEAATGRPVVPVFWLAGDDHDFDEIATATWIDTQGKRTSWTFTHRPDEPTGRPASSYAPGPEALADLEARVAASLAGRPHLEETRALLHQAAEGGGADLERWCGRLLAKLLRCTGLVFVAPRLDWMRRRAEQLIRRELAEPHALSALVRAEGEALRQRGEAPSLHRHADAANFFLLDAEGRRCRMTQDAATGEWNQTIPGVEGGLASVISTPALAALLEEEPQRFSPGVVLRPVLQDICLPTVAYLGGPGERAYFRQLAPVYSFLGVQMPEILARPGLVLIEPKVARTAEKLGLDLTETAQALARGGDEAKGAALRALSSPAGDELKAAVSSAAQEIEAALKSLQEITPGQAVTVRRAIDKLRASLATPLEKLSEAAARDAEALSGQRRDQWERLTEALLPGGVFQERVLNLVPGFIAGWGIDLALRLLATLAEAPGETTLLAVDLPPVVGTV